MDDCHKTCEHDLPDAAALRDILAAEEFHPFPPADARQEWQQVFERPWLRGQVPRLIEAAEEAAEAELPPIRATDYLSFFRTGQRDAHSGAARRRGRILRALMLGECAEGQGRFLDPLLDASWALAEETSWVMPPHLRGPDQPHLPDVAAPTVDLRAARVAATLAKVVYLFGPRMDGLSPLWRKRLNFEIRRQVVAPYLAEPSFWWEEGTNNWNAVCNSGVVQAVLFADFEPDERVRVLHKALRSIRHFLSGFTADGGCSEGPGYWAYGVRNFASLAYCVHCATGGEVDVLAHPLVPRILSYAPGMVLSDGKVANFADCGPGVSFRNGPIRWAAERVQVPATAALASAEGSWARRRPAVLDLYLQGSPQPFNAPKEAWWPELMLLVTRSEEGLVLAAKGGHNGEHHNHNDVGAFIVHRPGESLVCDLGAPKYTRQLFGPRRYELLCTRSHGHNVPYVNETEQGTGSEFRATDFRRIDETDGIGVEMELAGAYPPEARLQSLRRRLLLHRGRSPRVELVDEPAFTEAGGSYELPLYTEGRFVDTAQGAVSARGSKGRLRVEFEPEGVEAQVESIEHGDERLERRFGPELSRCTLRLRASPQRAKVRVLFIPAD